MMRDRRVSPRLHVSEAGVGVLSDLERRSCSGAKNVQVPPPAGRGEVVDSDSEEEDSDRKEAEKSA